MNSEKIDNGDTVKLTEDAEDLKKGSVGRVGTNDNTRAIVHFDDIEDYRILYKNVLKKLKPSKLFPAKHKAILS